MQPISIVGPDAAAFAGDLVDRLDGRVAVVECDREIADGGVAAPEAERAGSGDADTAVSLAADGSWTGSGTVDGLDDLLDGLAPDHDYLVVTGDPASAFRRSVSETRTARRCRER